MSQNGLIGLVFAAAMAGTITGHLLFYVYVWARMRNESEDE